MVRRFGYYIKHRARALQSVVWLDNEAVTGTRLGVMFTHGQRDLPEKAARTDMVILICNKNNNILCNMVLGNRPCVNDCHLKRAYAVNVIEALSSLNQNTAGRALGLRHDLFQSQNFICTPSPPSTCWHGANLW